MYRVMWSFRTFGHEATKIKVSVVFFILSTCFINVTCFDRYEGSVCVTGSKPGVCRKIMDCTSAWTDLVTRRILPKAEDVCCFENRVQIICCPNVQTEEEKKPFTNRLQKNETVPIIDAEYAIKKSNEMCAIYSNDQELEIRDFEGEEGEEEEEVTSPPKNRIARSANSAQVASREDDSKEEYLVEIRITNGALAVNTEFPHMAAIGFNESGANIKWACGGTLISDRYVLTAAHCLRDRTRIAQWVQLGSLHLDSADRSNRFEIVEKIAHPEYRPPALYNDIALLKLDRPVTLNHRVHPACLNTERVVAGLTCTATGWGVTDWASPGMSEHLLKTNIRVQDAAACNASFAAFIRSGRKLVNGVHDESIICAGDPNGKNDTCQGDSGGPIQVQVANSNDTFSVIGVTSFGAKACGNGFPGLYSRVSYFVPWIVSHVWPQPPAGEATEPEATRITAKPTRNKANPNGVYTPW